MKRTIITIAAVGLFTVPAVQAAKPAPGTLSIAAAPTAVKSGGSVTLSGAWDGPTIVGGDLKIQGVRIDEPVQQLAPAFRAKGVLSSNVRYAMQADSASGLMARPMVEGCLPRR